MSTDHDIDVIALAVEACALRNTSGFVGWFEAEQHVKQLFAETGESLVRLKAAYSDRSPRNEIGSCCEQLAHQVLRCGKLAFHSRPNDTVFIDEVFYGPAEAILSGIVISPAMRETLDSTYQEWHWHGH